MHYFVLCWRKKSTCWCFLFVSLLAESLRYIGAFGKSVGVLTALSASNAKTQGLLASPSTRVSKLWLRPPVGVSTDTTRPGFVPILASAVVMRVFLSTETFSDASMLDDLSKETNTSTRDAA